MIDRRVQLGDFLRRRRAAIEPTDIPAARGRRTPGLRREEVAELARVSVSLYTWLEQGRPVSVSVKSIDAITAALQCSSVECDHARALARGVTISRQEHISPTLRRFSDSLREHPFVVINHRWNIVLCNQAAKAVIFSLVDDPTRENLVRLTFGERGRALNQDWETVALSVVELLRFDLAYYDQSNGAYAIVDELRASDGDFERLWQAHGVRRAPRALRRFQHPTGITLTFDPMLMPIADAPGLRALIFTPCDDSTKVGVEELLGRRPAIDPHGAS